MGNARKVIRIGGEDAVPFLQNLVTNDVSALQDGPVYAALLTPQGKYIADFILSADGEDILMDVAEDLAGPLVQRLTMYKLRADVSLTLTDLQVHQGAGTPPSDGFADPRHPGLGWRAHRTDPASDFAEWDELRVAHGVPEGHDLDPDRYILEMGFERLNGVDFKKGCYVGQEVTARMKHKTELRKGLARVGASGAATSGAEITADGKPAGVLLTRSGDQALAYLRFDRAKGTLTAGDAQLDNIERMG